MKKIDDEIQLLLKEHNGNIREILEENSRLDYLYALSEQRELLLEWYDFDPEGELLQIGADYGAMTGLFRTSVAQVTVLDEDANALRTVELRYPGAANIRYENGSLFDLKEERAEGFDYVVFAGTLQAPYEEQLQAAKALLKPDGVLIVAVPNALGMKYFSGTADEANAMTKVQLAQLLQGDGSIISCLITAHRSAFIRISIFPRRDDMTRVTPAYDYPRYHMMDMGQKFDTACEAGLFDLYANSYLVFWSSIPERLENGEDPIYVKYNKTRKEVFQIKTCICEAKKEGGRRRYVEKAALSLAGSAHIDSFRKKEEELMQQHRVLKVASPEYRPDRNSAFFPYLEGQTWAEKLGQQISGRTASS